MVKVCGSTCRRHGFKDLSSASLARLPSQERVGAGKNVPGKVWDRLSEAKLERRRTEPGRCRSRATALYGRSRFGWEPPEELGTVHSPVVCVCFTVIHNLLASCSMCFIVIHNPVASVLMVMVR